MKVIIPDSYTWTIYWFQAKDHDHNITITIRYAVGSGMVNIGILFTFASGNITGFSTTVEIEFIRCGVLIEVTSVIGP